MSNMNSFLKSNERVLWSGKPVKAAFIATGLVAIPFGLIFLGFSLFWIWGAASAGAGFFAFFGLPFVLIGFGVTFGPTIWQLLRYRNTEYAITDQRVITQTGAIGLDTRFVDFDKIQEVYVKIGFADKLFGAGSVYVLTAGSNVFGYRGRSGYGSGGMRPSLGALREPYKVHKILQEAIETGKKS